MDRITGTVKMAGNSRNFRDEKPAVF